MSLTRKVAYNTGVQIVGKVITTLISLVLIAALTRYLGVAGFGQYTTIFAYTGFFAVLADFGFFWIFVREIAKPNADINKIASNILTLRTFFGILVFGLGFLISLFIKKYSGLYVGIGIISLASLFLALNSTYVGIFQNKLRMDRAAITDVLGRIVILLCILYLIKINAGLNIVLLSYAAGNAINFLASAILGRIFFQFKPSFDFAYWKELIIQAFPMGIVIILSMIYFKIDSVMLSLMRSSTDVGIYGPSYKVLDIVLILPSIFMGNIFPFVTRYIYEKNDKIFSTLQKAFEFMSIVSWPIILGIVFTSGRIIEIVAGTDFVTASTISPVLGMPATSATVLQILAFTIGFSFIANMFTFLIIALGKQSKLIGAYLFLVFFNIGINLILIPKISYIGAAFSTVITEIFVMIFTYCIARKYLIFKLDFNILWRVLISCLALSVFLYFTSSFLNFFILIPLATLIYTSVLYLVGGLKKETILSLIRKE